MEQKQNQEQILVDKNQKGKDRNWRGRKILSLKLADIFNELDYKDTLIERVKSCGDILRFIRESDGKLKLYQAYFCKNKLCPMCNWRRAMKYSYQTSQIVDEAIKEEPNGRFLFLTLTVKNVEGERLGETISSLTQSFDRLFRRAKVKKNLIGYLRSVEVTHNEKVNTYHPHVHVLLMVKSSYFKNSDSYISQEEWSQMWSQSLKVDYVPTVDIRAVKPQGKQGKGLKGAILETAKYPMKPINLDIKNAQMVDDLYNGLYRKRQIGYGGLFKEIRKRLRLSDVENGDLIHASEDENDVSVGTKIVAIWNATKQNYLIKLSEKHDL